MENQIIKVEIEVTHKKIFKCVEALRFGLFLSCDQTHEIGIFGRILFTIRDASLSARAHTTRQYGVVQYNSVLFRIIAVHLTLWVYSMLQTHIK